MKNKLSSFNFTDNKYNINNQCEYCSEIQGSIPKYIRDIIPETILPSRILLSTDNFVVFPTLGSFITGYLLIVPKMHYFSIKTMPKEIFEEFLDLKKTITSLLFKVYGKNCIFFEHGTNKVPQKIGCCIDHAHLHVVPTNLDISQKLRKSLNIIRYSDYMSFLNDSKIKGAYLSYEKQDGIVLISENQQIPSQFVRKLLASENNQTDKWDWAIYPFTENIVDTFNLLSCYIKN